MPVHSVIREAKQLLANHPAQHRRLDQFAAKLHMSYSSFRRLFKAETGFSPRQFVLEVQMRRAENLLLHTDSAVCRIAEECGFESVFYFSRLFKKKTGRTPTSFRNASSPSGFGHGKIANAS
jgi:AraC-like DNA-binding protein